MDDAIKEMLRHLPPNVVNQLDFTPESLRVVEAWLLATFPDIETLLKRENAMILDGIARYVGETFRENLGGEWILETEDPKMAHYSLPSLKLSGNRRATLTPATLVTTTVHRRKGDFLLSVFEAYKRD
ncbi:MAG: hypothetical protein R3300_21805 [Candidatus Promineifilaceae bacterium]|nr:hypothetical protein [Candidatus Promineifilaceae bacterium]